MTEEQRLAITKRIRALLAKTVDNGATEAEALTAAAKARQLMDAYRLAQTDLEVQAEPLDNITVDRPTDHRVSAVDLTLWGIDAYCGVRTWFGHSRNQEGKLVRKLRILGLRSDVEMATYLYNMIAATIKVETTQFDKAQRRPSMSDPERAFSFSWDSTKGETRRRNTSFQVGMARRIGERLKEMATALAPVAKTATGTSLVVVKNAVVEDAYAKISVGFTKGSSGPRARDHGAYYAGREAGGRVNLGRPVGNSSTISLR